MSYFYCCKTITESKYRSHKIISSKKEGNVEINEFMPMLSLSAKTYDHSRHRRDLETVVELVAYIFSIPYF